jgi:hypothetical protein
VQNIYKRWSKERIRHLRREWQRERGQQSARAGGRIRAPCSQSIRLRTDRRDVPAGPSKHLVAIEAAESSRLDVEPRLAITIGNVEHQMCSVRPGAQHCAVVAEKGCRDVDEIRAGNLSQEANGRRRRGRLRQPCPQEP